MIQSPHHVDKTLVVVFTVLPGGALDASALVAAHTFWVVKRRGPIDALKPHSAARLCQR